MKMNLSHIFFHTLNLQYKIYILSGIVIPKIDMALYKT